MDYIKELKELLESDVLKEVNENINDIKNEISKTKKNKALKEELQYMEQVKLYFDEILIDIANNTLTNEQALDILEGLDDMRVDNQEV